MSENQQGTDGEAKAQRPTASMYVAEESDHGVVPMNPSNKDGRPSAERGEGSAWTKENARPSYTYPTQRGAGVSQGLAGVRKAARERKQEQFTALLHHLTVDLLRASFYALKRQAAPGVDGVTWQEYETGLAERLADLHSRVHRGAYQAQPARRVYIPKADGQPCPLGIAALEDKLAQQAVVTILNQIYEKAFVGFSYGYRPGRSPHQALDALSVALTRKRGNYVLEYDIRGFFDNLSHEWLVRFLQQRVADPRVLHLIQKWLRAGVSEDGQWSETKVGVPQGAVASPFLANLYRHYVFDLWVAAWRKTVPHGAVVVVRFADDGVIGFEHRGDAERFLEELRERLRKFGLEVPPDQTRRLEFGPHAISNRQQRGEGKPETFDFLGFTHMCERHRKTGYFIVRRKTARKRMVAKLKAIQQQLRHRRYEPIAQTGQWLGSVVQGYFNSHAVPGNMRTLGTFRRRVIRLWRRQLRLRSQKARMNWQRFGGLIQRWIPTQRILHPFPSVRFDATHPR